MSTRRGNPTPKKTLKPKKKSWLKQLSEETKAMRRKNDPERQIRDLLESFRD